MESTDIPLVAKFPVKYLLYIDTISEIGDGKMESLRR